VVWSYTLKQKFSCSHNVHSTTVMFINKVVENHYSIPAHAVRNVSGYDLLGNVSYDIHL
jgi:hypothetical protein